MNMDTTQDDEQSGMSLNERLLVKGLLSAWDQKAHDRDEEGMVSILLQAGISERQAAETVKIVLENPSKYGF